jgi:hypothetical protein
MKANSVLPQRDGESFPTAIKCVIIYEDFASGVRAKHFAEMLADGLGGTCDCESLWRSELLEFPEIGDGVAREAAASDFVILALRGDRHLSFGFKRWIESWLTPAMDGGLSLIALFDSNRRTSHAASARYSLREMSAMAGVAFFAHCPSGNDVLPPATLPEHAEVAERTSPRPRSLRRQRLRRIPVTA